MRRPTDPVPEKRSKALLWKLGVRLTTQTSWSGEDWAHVSGTTADLGEGKDSGGGDSSWGEAITTLSDDEGVSTVSGCS